MDDPAQALAYAEADFSEANGLFVERFLACFGDGPRGVLDLGCGPGDIAVRLARRLPGARLFGVDGAAAMLDLARARVARERLGDRVEMVQALVGPACEGPVPPAGWADAVVSNSLLHHLADPLDLWRAVRHFGAPGAAVLVMDLHRPASAGEVAALVGRYAADAPEVLRRDFENSLRAAYTVGEVARQLAECGLQDLVVERPSDRHWLAYGRLSGGGGAG